MMLTGARPSCALSPLLQGTFESKWIENAEAVWSEATEWGVEGEAEHAPSPLPYEADLL